MQEKTFGKILIFLRERRNLTRIQLESELGIKYSTLSNYENNKRQPDFDTLKLIAKFFHVSVDYLIGNTNKEFDLKNYEIHMPMSEAVKHLQQAIRLLQAIISKGETDD